MFGRVTRRAAALAAAVVALVLAGAGAGPSGAQAPPAAGDPCAPLTEADAAPFAANTNRVGLVDLHFFNADGVPVRYYECVGGRAESLGVVAMPNAAITSLRGARPWLCGRLTRHFAATATLRGGVAVRGVTSVRTKSCAQRFDVSVPRQVERGGRPRVRISDRWGVGRITTRLCITSPHAKRSCQTVRFPAAASVATRRFRASDRGAWRVDLQVKQYHVRDTVAVGVEQRAVKRLPRLLATGDSTMQGVESALSDELGSRFDAVSDVRPGFSISSADGWATIAQAQVTQLASAVTVISLGAAEGFAMRAAGGARVECCEEPWVAEYTRRVRRVMNVYRRGGKARLFYLTIPAPLQPARQLVVMAVNQAIVRAAARLKGVTVLRMDLLFSPAGYQPTIRDGGRDIPIREPDGVHLNASGTAIEARETAKAVRGQATVVPAG